MVSAAKMRCRTTAPSEALPEICNHDFISFSIRTPNRTRPARNTVPCTSPQEHQGCQGGDEQRACRGIGNHGAPGLDTRTIGAIAASHYDATVCGDVVWHKGREHTCVEAVLIREHAEEGTGPVHSVPDKTHALITITPADDHGTVRRNRGRLGDITRWIEQQTEALVWCPVERL